MNAGNFKAAVIMTRSALQAATREKQDDAEELIGLAESIFEYLYVIPAEVTRRRQRLAP